MTREHKLALIIGFTLVLVVGVLLSDHLSTSRKTGLGGPELAEAAPQLKKDETMLFTNRLNGSPVNENLTTPATSPATLAASNEPKLATNLPEPVTPVRMGEKSGETSSLGTLAGNVGSQFSKAIDDLSNGHTPPTGAAIDQIPDGALSTPDTSRPSTEQTSLIPSGNGLDVAPGVDDSATGSRGTKSKTEPKTQATNIRKHQIAEGETFWKIAKSEYGDAGLADKLKAYNKDRIGKSGHLRVGASLLIPEKSVLLAGEKAPKDVPATPATSLASEKKSKFDGVPTPEKIEKAKVPTDSAKKASASTYKVQKGDTLGKIAAKLLGSSGRAEDILNANKAQLEDEDSITVGMDLKIPAR